MLPQRGRLVAIHSGESHCVEEVAGGERCMLVVWFTRNSQSREDSRLLELLLSPGPGLRLPPAMRLGPEGAGEDVRLARLRCRGVLDQILPWDETQLHLRILALEQGGGDFEAWMVHKSRIREAMATALPMWADVGELY